MSLAELAEFLKVLRESGVTFYECNGMKIVLGPSMEEPEVVSRPELPPGMERMPMNYQNPRLFSHVGGLKGFGGSDGSV